MAALPGGSGGTPGMSSGTGGGASMQDSTAGGTGGAADPGRLPMNDAGPAVASDASSPHDAASGATEQVLVPDPSWTCGMAGGIPPPQRGELVFEATLNVAKIHDVGETQYGHREQIDLGGGSLKGPKIDAQVQSGALDYQLTLATGSLEVEELMMLQAGDGTLMYLRVCGLGAGPDDVRVVPDFEAPTGGGFAWLNNAKLAGTRELDRNAMQVKLRVYDISSLSAPQASLQLHDPVGVPNQSWDCATPSGSAGATVYMESVGIGASLLVGSSKRGTRNVIPITSGTATGRISGKVLAGGADFQLLGASFILDARYAIEADDGTLIIVRNCGPLGAIVPVFESRKDGAYGWLDKGSWLSGNPGIGVGVVNLTIYEAN